MRPKTFEKLSVNIDDVYCTDKVSLKDTLYQCLYKIPQNVCSQPNSHHLSSQYGPQPKQ